ncbi:glutathionyl-hydroquinone reductase PcpF [Ricinus communis]|uniref:glutathionyl-hydroquinone reductase PcpF n=1 Tax=Ricinus communis TaxID=3988 RepID=UPI00201AAE18|nr:glutathionyl-hydroquinone reductase PcpF [Ricinus communis]
MVVTEKTDKYRLRDDETMYCTSLPSSHYPTPTVPTKSNRKCHTFPKMSLDQTPPPNPKTLITTLTNLLWGQSLPPGLLISTVRTTWNSAWQLMMSQLAPSDSSGSYSRPTSKFRISRNPNFQSFHLYVGLPCPWAHRTLIVRALKGLEHAIPVSIAAPGQDGSWVFDSGQNMDKDTLVPGKDSANGCKSLKEVYGLRQGGYNGRATVPMLWDSERKEVLCNESYDIIEFFNSGLNGLARNPDLDLAPKFLKGKIEEWNQVIYPNVNNGVYRCGFAQSQAAYDRAVNDLFSTLDRVENHLGSSRYLCGDTITLADVCLFTTLIRFDLAYNVLFKCTKKKLLEYPNLHGYMCDIYQIPKVAETCNFSAIMDGYYKVLFPLNPGSIRPVIPSGCEHEFLSAPHNRESLLSSVDKTMQVFVS